MRKQTQNKAVKTAKRVIVQGYHHRETYELNYAVQGFAQNKYFTSDRTKKLDEHFQLEDLTPLKGYGLEIEVECSRINNAEALAFTLENVAFQYVAKDLFKYQRDGSLNGLSSSVEAITQVMTKEFLRNQYPAFKYAYDVFKLYGIEATANCGMHCNMSLGLFGTTAATIQEALRKFVYFINKNYQLSCSLVKRDPERAYYCSQMDDWDNKNYAKQFDFSTTNEDESNHGICFNYYHFNSGRVELRLVGGQKTYAAFRNTLETIFHLVEAVKRCSWSEIDDMKKVFKGCNKYVLSRLEDCMNNGTLSRDDYNSIASNIDTSIDFGNY